MSKRRTTKQGPTPDAVQRERRRIAFYLRIRAGEASEAFTKLWRVDPALAVDLARADPAFASFLKGLSLPGSPVRIKV